MRIWITGHGGFVGSALMKRYPQAIPAPSLQNVTLEELRGLLESVRPDVILHTAAISDTGVCQRDPESSYRANVALPEMLARVNPGAKLVCFSSDQVYMGSPGPGPYREEEACPANVYGVHKLEMERRVLDIDPEAVMLRSQWMYDLSGAKNNYLRMLLTQGGSLCFSREQFRGLTYLRETAEAMDTVMALPGGVYNFGSETELSMYEITEQMLCLLKRDTPLTEGPPRHNLWMDCGKAKKSGIHFSSVTGALTRCLRDYGYL